MDAEPAEGPQAQPAPRPEVVRSGGGFLDGLKRKLRPQPPVVQAGPFVTVTEVKPTPTRARFDAAEKLRQPSVNPKASTTLAGTLKSTAKSFVGHSPARANGATVAHAAPVLTDRATAEATLRQLFSPPASTRPGNNPLAEPLMRNGAQQATEQLAERLTERLMHLAGQADSPYLSQPLSVALTLAPLVGSDAERAMAALDALGSTRGSAAALADAFALQRSLATTSLGFEALQALMPATAHEDDAAHAQIRKDATMRALRAADELVRRLPPGAPAPQGLQDVVDMATAMLPSATPRPRDRRQVLPRGDLLAAKALVCAAELQANPQAMPAAPLREAYFDWRNGFTTEGRGSDLEKAKARLFKLHTYGQRAASTDAKPFMQRVLGLGKSPLSALRMGSAGARLRNPKDDFKRFEAVETFVEALQEQVRTLAAQPGNPDARDAAVRKTVRAAAAWRYMESIGKKGWRDEVNVSSTMRHQILQDALEMLQALPMIDKESVRRSPEYQGLKDTGKYLGLKKVGKMDTGKLETWAREELLGMTDEEFQSHHQRIEQLQARLDGVQAAGGPQGNGELEWLRDDHLARQRDKLKPVADIYRLRELNNNGDLPFPENGTSKDVLALLRDVMANARPTFDVRYTDGGIHGLNANIAETIQDAASAVGIPAAVVAPNLKLIRGRQALVNVGSAAMGGTLFVGTDTRYAAQAGVAATAGWSLPGKYVSFGAGIQVTPLSHASSSPQGVMIRTRMQSTGPAEPAPAGAPNWFALDKLLGVYDSLTKTGPAGDLPQSKEAMWTGMSDRYFKDPDVSVTWLGAKASNTSSSASLTGGAFATIAGYRAGPTGGIGSTRNWANKLHRSDENGSMPVQTIAHSSGRISAVTGALVAVPRPVAQFPSEPGEVSQVALPSVPIVGATIPLLGSSAGVTLRMSQDGDRIIPDVTYRDLEFTSINDYLNHVDVRNDAWARSCSAPGTDGQQVLNHFLTEVRGDADRGNQIFVERQSMKPEAARSIDAITETQKRLVPKGRPPTAAEQATLASLSAEANRVMQDPDSWRNRFLYVMEADTSQRVVGNSYLVQAQTQTDVSHLHMTAALKANN